MKETQDKPLQIERQKVASSNIASIGFHAQEAAIQVEFLSGQIYNYFPCSEGEFQALIKAPSVGAHFSKHIRDIKSNLHVGAALRAPLPANRSEQPQQQKIRRNFNARPVTRNDTSMSLAQDKILLARQSRKLLTDLHSKSVPIE